MTTRRKPPKAELQRRLGSDVELLQFAGAAERYGVSESALRAMPASARPGFYKRAPNSPVFFRTDWISALLAGGLRPGERKAISGLQPWPRAAIQRADEPALHRQALAAIRAWQALELAERASGVIARPLSGPRHGSEDLSTWRDLQKLGYVGDVPDAAGYLQFKRLETRMQEEPRFPRPLDMSWVGRMHDRAYTAVPALRELYSERHAPPSVIMDVFRRSLAEVLVLEGRWRRGDTSGLAEALGAY